MYRLALAIIILCTSPVSYADQMLKCSADQSFCTIRDKTLAVGDHIVFLNERNELIAFGKVERIDGPLRRIEMIHRFGDIKKGHRALRFDSSSVSVAQKKYRTFYRLGKYTAGGGLSLIKLNVGENVGALGIDGFAEYTWIPNIDITARTFMLFASGNAVGDFDAPTLEGRYSMFGFALMPGIALNYGKNQPWGVRAEASLGFMYATAAVNGNSKIVENYVPQIGQGFGLLLRSEASTHLRFDRMRPGLGFGYMRMHNANSFYLLANFSYDI